MLQSFQGSKVNSSTDNSARVLKGTQHLMVQMVQFLNSGNKAAVLLPIFAYFTEKFVLVGLYITGEKFLTGGL